MRRGVMRIALLAWAVPLICPAASLGQTNAMLTMPWGSTLADAMAEARVQKAACEQPRADCRTEGPSPKELVGDRETCAGDRAVMSWRNAAELSNAEFRAMEFSRLARMREPFDCGGGSCLLVIPTVTPDEKESNVSTLSVCRVEVVNGVAGAPRRCEEAVKEHPNSGLLLRAQAGNSYVACSMGLPDFDAVFRGRASELAAVRRLVMDVLTAKPFNLAVMEDRRSIVGTRAQLSSEVLKGWREWVTVRVDIDAMGIDAGTTITTTILVSKQAAAEREAWTPPSEAQEAAYLLALRNEFHRRGGNLSTGLQRR